MVKIHVIKEGENFFERIYLLKNKHGKIIQTPTISVPFKYIKNIANETSASMFESIFEIYRKSTYNKLRSLLQTPQFSQYINRRIISDSEKITTIIVAWTNPTLPLKEKEFLKLSTNLLDTLNYEKIVNDNLIVPPFWYRLKRIKNIPKGWNFLKRTTLELLDKLEQIISQPKNILGYVPIFYFSRDSLRKLLDYYIDKDITNFLVDFGGRNIETLKDSVNVLLQFKRIHENDKIIYYAFNTFRGQFRKKDEIPAREFLSLFTGFDILGTFSRRGIPSDVKIESRPRIFKRDTYTYAKTEANLELKVLNIARKIAETNKMKTTLIRENSFITLIENKPKDVKKIVKNIISQKRLKIL